MPKKIITLGLVSLMLFFFFSNFMVLGGMCHPLGYNYRGHLMSAVSISKGFNQAGFWENPIGVYTSIIMNNKDYPPLYYVFSAVINHFFGINLMFMTSTLFLILLIFCTYKIGNIVKDQTTGLLSAAILSFYPIIYLSSRNFDLELAQTAMVCASLYLLIRCDKFNNRKYSFLFGTVFGAGMLVKQQTLIFIVGPLFADLFAVFKDSKVKKAPWMNMLIAAFMSGAIGFCFFYFRYLDQGCLKYIFVRSKLPGEIKIDPVNWLNVEHVLFYFNSLKKYQIGIVNLILLLFSIPIFYLKREYIKYRVFLTAWFIVPLVLLTLVPAKYSEYTISYLPVLAIVTASGMLSFRHLAIKLGLISLTLGLNMLLFYSYIMPDYPHWKLANPALDDFLGRINVAYTISSANRFHNKDVLKTVNSDYKAVTFLNGILPNKKSKVGLVTYLSNPTSTPETDIELFLSLYTLYELKNPILDPAADELDVFDAIIFVPSRYDKDEKWLNKSYYIQEMEDFNKWQYALMKKERSKGPEQFFKLYFLYDDISLMPNRGNYFPIFHKQLEKIVNYYPKLKLIQKIEGLGQNGNIFIYQKL